MNLLKISLIALIMLASACTKGEATPNPEPDPEPVPAPTGPEGLMKVASKPSSWVVYTPDGRLVDEVSPVDTSKKIGIFYFLWHGCHGYDTPANNNSVVPPTSKDVNSPYNNEEIYSANPSNPSFGDFYVMHHWGKPYLDYYLSNDRWVFRKHAQMLSDAGVDVLMFDVTNGFHYIDNVKILAEEFLLMRKQGCATPQFAFVFHAATTNTFNVVYDQIYAKGLYRDLWFMWDGKPLVLAAPADLPSARQGEFTIRESWFNYNSSSSDAWYASGEDKWPWGGWYPQKPGLHGGMVEMMPVMPATHAHDNIGRSCNAATRIEPGVKTPEKGIYFHAQADYALSKNPQFLFFTGWNEWTAQRQKPQSGVGMIGMKSTDFGCYFVDQFNHEYSRDFEPVEGGFGDAYYYMLVEYSRKFKGTTQHEVHKKKNTIALDGICSDWQNAGVSYGDDEGDTYQRNHYGWGNVGKLINLSGRNDIILSKVAHDDENIYFYVQTSSALTSRQAKDWMKLYISTNSGNTSWEGFDFAVGLSPSSQDVVNLSRNNGGYNWATVATVRRAVAKKFMEIAIPLDILGCKTKGRHTIDFKWIDNACSSGDIQTCLRDGDSAPDGRFRYRYIFELN